MGRLTQRVLTAAAATTAAVALSAVSAFASPIAGQNVEDVVAYDISTGSALFCTSSTLAGDAPSAPGPLFVIDAASFSSPGEVNDWCLANGSIPTQVVATNLPWVFTAGSPLGELAGVSLTLHMPSVPCTATITSPGDVSGTYTSGPPNILNLNDDDLEVSNSSCPFLFAQGDDFRFVAQYEIS
ncbi:hypothetical protein [Actinomadura sp. GTD37]|uniref:hypothetical protein n=1 Tax=Actinomadura sp. GTD37 TaxID=1778030 RepID=UPI0035BFF7B6